MAHNIWTEAALFRIGECSPGRPGIQTWLPNHFLHNNITNVRVQNGKTWTAAGLVIPGGEAPMALAGHGG